MYYEINSADRHDLWDAFINDIAKGDSLVLFYYPECPYCQGMYQEWFAFAKSLDSSKDDIPVYRILKDLKYKVPSHISEQVSVYPTILHIYRNQIKKDYPRNAERSESNFKTFYKNMKLKGKKREKKTQSKIIKKGKKIQTRELTTLKQPKRKTKSKTRSKTKRKTRSKTKGKRNTRTTAKT